MRTTALKQYQKLESPGLWREAPEMQRREVIVAFGEASLTLSDPRTEAALSHWSLPAVERLNPGEIPALFAPGQDALETLELDDPTMIAALEKVRHTLATARPRPGRLRGSLLLAGTALVLLAGAVFVPGAMIDHTAAMVPPTMRKSIGRTALADLSQVAGAPCSDVSGLSALEKLSARLFGENPPQLVVLRDGTALSLHLPGRIIALHRSLIENQNSPDVAAGFALAEAERMSETDPMLPLLEYAGVRATFGLLTTGRLAPGSVQGYGRLVLTEPPSEVDTEHLLTRFAEAGVASTPYARAVDPSGESVLRLIEADPFAQEAAPPLLKDGDWISLQAICAE